MPYPFTCCITWEQLIQQMEGLGVRFVERKMAVSKGSHLLQYFEHEMDGKTLVHAVDVQDRTDRLLPSVIRELCQALRINPVLFGLNLG